MIENIRNFWQNKRCLVTGGFGFGGSHLCEKLIEKGAKIYVLDRLCPNNSYLVLVNLANKVNYINGDVRDLDLLKTIFERFEIDMVFHLAAQPVVPINNAIPYESLSLNVLGTYSVLEAMRLSTSTKTLIFASSGAYYGTTTQKQPISEEHPPTASANIYSPSKIAGDIAVRCYAKTYGIKAATCRFINTYGPGNINFSTIVPKAITNLITRTSFDFGERDDGTSTFDYLYIQDMAKAYLAVAENLDHVSGEAFNFGGDYPISVRDLVKMISMLYDGEPREPVFHGPKRDMPIYKCLDTTKAQSMLGWQVTITLEDGLKQTIDWYKRYWSRL